jgi:hypothetical protein
VAEYPTIWGGEPFGTLPPGTVVQVGTPALEIPDMNCPPVQLPPEMVPPLVRLPPPGVTICAEALDTSRSANSKVSRVALMWLTPSLGKEIARHY